jgi:hypothetical protein
MGILFNVRPCWIPLSLSLQKPFFKNKIHSLRSTVNMQFIVNIHHMLFSRIHAYIQLYLFLYTLNLVLTTN